MRPSKITANYSRLIFFQTDSVNSSESPPGTTFHLHQKPLRSMWIQQKDNKPAPLADLQGRTVGLKFNCSKCHTEVFTDLIGVPAPNDLADSPAHADNHEIEEIKCPKCAMTHTLEVDSSFDGVTFKVSDAKHVSYQVSRI